MSDSESPSVEDVQSLRLEGNELFKAKKYGSALDKYTEAIDAQESIRIASLKAKSAPHVNGNGAASSSSSSSAQSPTADDGSLYLNRAAAYMAISQHNKAVLDCRKAIKTQEEQQGEATVKASLRFCRALVGCGELEEARTRLDSMSSSKKATADEKKQIATLSSQLQSLQQYHTSLRRDLVQKEYRMASHAIEQLTGSALIPCPPLSWRVTSLSLLYIRSDSLLQSCISKAIDLHRSNPTSADCLLLRGRIFLASGDTAKAIQHCQAALRNDSEVVGARELMRFCRSIEAIKEQGNQSAKRGSWAQAKEKYTEALEAMGAEKAAAEDGDVEMADGSEANGSSSASSSSATSFLSLLGDLHMTEGGSRMLRATFFSNRATANLKLKTYEDALSDCNRCLALTSSYLKALRTRARTHLAMDSFADSITDFKEAIENISSTAGSDADDASMLRSLKQELAQAERLQKRSLTKDHYKILGLARDCSEIEIKKAYRVMSLKHHPDKGGDEAKFKDISEAYSILSDPEKRRRYDSGADDDPMMGGGNPFGGGGMGGGVDLSDLFGGGMGGGHPFGGGMGGFPGGGFPGGARAGPGGASSFHFG